MAIEQAAASSAPSGSPVVDIHRHCFAGHLEKDMLASGLAKLTRDGISITHRGVTTVMGGLIMDLDGQIRGQDAAGVTKAVLSFVMLLEMVSVDLRMSALEVARRLNDGSAELVARYPDKLDFMAMVCPFEESSIDECERCFNDLGAKGISLCTTWNGQWLDSRQIDPFWEYAQASGRAIFLHPPQVPTWSQPMNVYRLEEAIGRPFDEMMNVSRMIYSGVFDRYPRLKIVLCHTGGGILDLLGRLDFTYRIGYSMLPPEQAAVCQRTPSDYLRTNLYVDTMGFSASTIRQALETFGPDRVLFGSDYPAVPFSPKEQIDIVDQLGLGEADRARVLWQNANELFGLGIGA